MLCRANVKNALKFLFWTIMQKDIYRLSLLLLILSSNSEILSCNIKVCLTWMANTNTIEFRCRVDDLIFQVKFLNKFNSELAHCPFPIRDSNETSCYSYFINSTIVQDLKTNTTTLTVRGQIDKRINGEWSCQHGTNISQAIVNVTAWIGDSKCWQKFAGWTYIGFLSSIVTSVVVKTVLDLLCQKRSKYKDFCRNCNEFFAKRCIACVMGCFCFCMLLLPLLIGSVWSGSDCINQEVFFVCGFVIMPPLWLASGTRLNVNQGEETLFRNSCCKCTSEKVPSDSKEETEPMMDV